MPLSCDFLWPAFVLHLDHCSLGLAILVPAGQGPSLLNRKQLGPLVSGEERQGPCGLSHLHQSCFKQALSLSLCPRGHWGHRNTPALCWWPQGAAREGKKWRDGHSLPPPLLDHLPTLTSLHPYGPQRLSQLPGQHPGTSPMSSLCQNHLSNGIWSPSAFSLLSKSRAPAQARLMHGQMNKWTD